MKQKKKITKTKKTIKRGCKKQPTKTVSKKKNVLKNKNKSTKKVQEFICNIIMYNTISC